MTALLVIHCLADRLVLETDRALTEPLSVTIDRYLFSERAELEDVTAAWGILTVAGPESRKIVEDDERRRLKSMLKEIRQESGGGGLIARTAGLGRSRDDFERDARYLKRTWDEVRAVAARERPPLLLHREPSLVQRLLRDLLSDDVASIRLDQEKEYRRTLELVGELAPELAAATIGYGIVLSMVSLPFWRYVLVQTA